MAWHKVQFTNIPLNKGTYYISLSLMNNIKNDFTPYHFDAKVENLLSNV